MSEAPDRNSPISDSLDALGEIPDVIEAQRRRINGAVTRLAAQGKLQATDLQWFGGVLQHLTEASLELQLATAALRANEASPPSSRTSQRPLLT